MLRSLFTVWSALAFAAAGTARAETMMQAAHKKVLGCDKSYCSYHVAFNTPFPDGFVPTVTCSVGPDANPAWGPLTCMIVQVDEKGVQVKLDSANGNEKIDLRPKDIHLIALYDASVGG